MVTLPILHRLKSSENPPLTRELIAELERALGVRFPQDYFEFLLQFNGGWFPDWAKFDVPGDFEIPGDEVQLLTGFIGREQVEYGEFRRIRDLTEDFLDIVPEKHVPIANCNQNDYAVLRFVGPKADFDGVWFWDRSALPSRGEQVVYPVADSFTEFLGMLRIESKRKQADPLFHAIERGDLPRVERYLAKGGDPNRRNVEGQTLLKVACSDIWPKIVRLLLEHSADPNARDKMGRTPLHSAADRSNEIVKMLLAAGADPKARDNNGRSIRNGWHSCDLLGPVEAQE